MLLIGVKFRSGDASLLLLDMVRASASVCVEEEGGCVLLPPLPLVGFFDSGTDGEGAYIVGVCAPPPPLPEFFCAETEGESTPGVDLATVRSSLPLGLLDSGSAGDGIFTEATAVVFSLFLDGGVAAPTGAIEGEGDASLLLLPWVCFLFSTDASVEDKGAMLITSAFVTGAAVGVVKTSFFAIAAAAVGV